MNEIISDEDLMRRLRSVEQVEVSWIENATDGYLYSNRENTIFINHGGESIRFTLKEKNGDDKDFEVIIRKIGDSFHCEIDHPDLEKKTFALVLYVSVSVLIFAMNDVHHRVYFHLS